MNTRNIVIGLVLLLLLGGGFLALGGGSALGPKPTPSPVSSLDELDYLLTASGSLVPAVHSDLSFEAGGVVSYIGAQPGQAVRKGEVLARLDASDLEATVQQAQAALDVARADLALLQAGAGAEEVAQSEAAVKTAEAQLAQVRAPASREDVAIAKASLDRADAALKNAQSEYDKVRGNPAIGMLPQSASLQLATQEYQISSATYAKVLNGASPEEIRVAEAGVAEARASVERVKAAARSEAVAAAQARVSQAEAALKQAQAALATAVISAPFDGTVARVNLEQAEVAMPGVPAVTLGDVSHLRLETDDLSETSIASVEIAQPVQVTFEALPGKVFMGRVTHIAPISTEKQGGTNYTVFVEMDQLDPVLRWGMTGHIEIDTRKGEAK